MDGWLTSRRIGGDPRQGGQQRGWGGGSIRPCLPHARRSDAEGRHVESSRRAEPHRARPHRSVAVRRRHRRHAETDQRGARGVDRSDDGCVLAGVIDAHRAIATLQPLGRTWQSSASIRMRTRAFASLRASGAGGPTFLSSPSRIGLIRRCSGSHRPWGRGDRHHEHVGERAAHNHGRSCSRPRGSSRRLAARDERAGGHPDRGPQRTAA